MILKCSIIVSMYGVVYKNFGLKGNQNWDSVNRRVNRESVNRERGEKETGRRRGVFF